MGTKYKISDVERLIGLNRRAIQFYTKEGVIIPLSGGGKRGQACIYSRESMIEFGIIKQLAAFGVNLQKLKNIIAEFRKPTSPPKMRYRRGIIRDGMRRNSFIVFLFNSDSDPDDFEAIYNPGGHNEILTAEDIPSNFNTEQKLPGMNRYESSLVINIGRIIEKVGDE